MIDAEAYVVDVRGVHCNCILPNSNKIQATKNTKLYIKKGLICNQFDKTVMLKMVKSKEP